MVQRVLTIFMMRRSPMGTTLVNGVAWTGTINSDTKLFLLTMDHAGSAGKLGWVILRCEDFS